ncbi:MAG: hypothetical protein ABI818_09170 [Acidobacteriota bacterium]
MKFQAVGLLKTPVTSGKTLKLTGTCGSSQLTGWCSLRDRPPAVSESVIRRSKIRDSAIRDAKMRDAKMRDAVIRDAVIRDPKIHDARVVIRDS